MGKVSPSGPPPALAAAMDVTGDLHRVNAALRRIVTADQRAYAKSAR